MSRPANEDELNGAGYNPTPMYPLPRKETQAEWGASDSANWAKFQAGPNYAEILRDNPKLESQHMRHRRIMMADQTIRVWILFENDDSPYCGDRVLSVWTNQAQAEREQERLQALHPERQFWSHTECTQEDEDWEIKARTNIMVDAWKQR